MASSSTSTLDKLLQQLDRIAAASNHTHGASKDILNLAISALTKAETMLKCTWELVIVPELSELVTIAALQLARTQHLSCPLWQRFVLGRKKTLGDMLFSN